MEQNEFPVARRRLCERVDANWASGIPPSWDAPRIKSLLNERNEREHPDQPLLAATQKQGVILKERYENRTVLPTDTDELSQFKLVEKGDFVISLRSFQGGVERAHDKGIISPAYTILRSSKPETVEYLTRLFKSRPFIEILTTCVTGIRQGQNIDYTRLGTQRIPLPPPNEQTVIVRYLDDADQRVRAYVSAKERLIALLEEERQAVIHQAVTRGLDPNAKLKHSGVEWLGDVPEHWEVAQFARQVEIAEGQVDPKVEPYTSMLTIAPNHVESGTGRLLNRETAFEQGAISGKYICRDGDVIYSKIRPALAKVTVAPTDCLCSADMYPLRPRNPLQRDYLFWLLLSTGFTAWSTAQSERVAMPKVNRQTLNNTYIPLPPHPEQASIAQYVTEATGGTYKAIDRARRQIQLMEEYRTRLIADVVTGKIDVSRSLNPYQQDVS